MLLWIISQYQILVIFITKKKWWEYSFFFKWKYFGLFESHEYLRYVNVTFRVLFDNPSLEGYVLTFCLRLTKNILSLYGFIIIIATWNANVRTHKRRKRRTLQYRNVKTPETECRPLTEATLTESTALAFHAAKRTKLLC